MNRLSIDRTFHHLLFGLTSIQLATILLLPGVASTARSMVPLPSIHQFKTASLVDARDQVLIVILRLAGSILIEVEIETVVERIC